MDADRDLVVPAQPEDCLQDLGAGVERVFGAGLTE
jgi:hypothetical protein